MSTTPCAATVRRSPGITSINIRTGPGAHTAILGTVPTGATGLRVLDVRPDERETKKDGKLFQWFYLDFPDGRRGWVRDDLIDINGDCTLAGYGRLGRPTHAFALTRGFPPPSPEEQERIRRAAFNITSSFEGGSYATYQTYDAGIVSYGRFQFTLASGSLLGVIQAFLVARPLGTISAELRTKYFDRIRNRDATLGADDRLRALLQAAAIDPAMQRAQDKVATEIYWDRVQSMTILPRLIRTPLGQALLFDMGINHGLYHTITGEAEHRLDVEQGTRIGDSGLTEEKLITEVAIVRRDRLYAIANQRGLGGLKVRADFWMALVTRGDWTLQGDTRGEVTTYTGKRVQVRKP